jgi:hypothetical protein
MPETLRSSQKFTCKQKSRFDDFVDLMWAIIPPNLIQDSMYIPCMRAPDIQTYCLQDSVFKDFAGSEARIIAFSLLACNNVWPIGASFVQSHI